jgi:DNA-binding NarL/FixJ family response regulator
MGSYKSPDSAIELVALAPVLMIEDDPSMQQRLTRILQSIGCPPKDVVSVSTIKDALNALGKHTFSAALVDVGLPDGNGIDLIAEFSRLAPQMISIVISTFGSANVVMPALRAGAVGYLMKDRNDDEIAMLLRSIRRGGSPIDPFVASGILALVSQGMPPPGAAAVASPKPRLGDSLPPPISKPLSRRELQILQLVAQGHTNSEIAELVDLSKQTVECHTKHIYRKLAVGSRTEAVHRARQSGLLL